MDYESEADEIVLGLALSSPLFFTPPFSPRKYLVSKTSCPRIENKNLYQNKSRKFWDFEGIKKATIFGVHFDRGFKCQFATKCSVVFHPYFMASLVGFRGFYYLKCKGRKGIKKGYQKYFEYLFVLH